MDEIKALLRDNLIGTLATLNEDGSPWSTPLHVFADDGALYWFSADTHQHSVNIERDSRVSMALWSKVDGVKGAYVSGRAEKLEGDEAAAATDIVVATLGSIPPVFENTSAYRLKVGSLNSSKSLEKRWYFYS